MSLPEIGGIGRPLPVQGSSPRVLSMAVGSMPGGVPVGPTDVLTMDGGVTGTPGERLAQEQVLQRDVIAPFLEGLGSHGDRDLGKWVMERAFDTTGPFGPVAVGTGFAKIVQAYVLAKPANEPRGTALMQADIQFNQVAGMARGGEDLAILCEAYAAMLPQGARAAMAELGEICAVRDDAAGNRLRERSWSSDDFGAQQGAWLRAVGWTGSTRAADELVDLLAMPVGDETHERREQALVGLAEALRPTERGRAVDAYRCALTWRQPGDDVESATGRLRSMLDLFRGDARGAMATLARLVQGVRSGAFGSLGVDQVMERLVSGTAVAATVSGRLEAIQAELARLALQSTGDHTVQQGAGEVVIGGIRIPVRGAEGGA